nr:glycosyltransferase [Lachnospiraceae bacterium]
MCDEPLISVVMATYNDAQDLKRSVGSILRQTFRRLEMIIIDDGSTDNTQEVLLGIQDDRLVLIKNDKNKGLPYSLNRGIMCARGKYIARMDADDISFPKRLELQYEYMESHPDITICGCDYVYLNENRKPVYYHVDDNSDEIRSRVIYTQPLAHPSWVIRKADISGKIKYNNKFKRSQDYEMMCQIIKHGLKLGNVEKTLLFYDYRDNSISHKNKTRKWQILV